ncbi:hypothetical protein V474_24075 [Novosphingobium barchaimii LL02]|uniref:Uncharacterized protein n=1 Tax=Novosphingobium barchaimii LL02 TaxID=1114963 RepID=A0A0J7XMS1_9SPHN|nr:hypothetical protein V474_24075 [Novosphingobium barchaimii LL02]
MLGKTGSLPGISYRFANLHQNPAKIFARSLAIRQRKIKLDRDVRP